MARTSWWLQNFTSMVLKILQKSFKDYQVLLIVTMWIKKIFNSWKFIIFCYCGDWTRNKHGREETIELIGLNISCFSSKRTNLSPFTKDFRAEEQLREKVISYSPSNMGPFIMLCKDNFEHISDVTSWRLALLKNIVLPDDSIEQLEVVACLCNSATWELVVEDSLRLGALHHCSLCW